jgi:outer membrane protein assembly factor BamB
VSTPAPVVSAPVAVEEKPLKLEIVAEDELTADDVVEDELEVIGDEHAVLPERRKTRRSVWDSPLIVLGGGTLALLTFATAGIVWSLLRVTGEEAFALAEADYKQGAYTQSIAKIDDYLARHSAHKDVSRAKVMRALATIRRDTEGAKDFTKALGTAKQQLSAVEEEEGFAQARAELAGLLPDIAEGLSRQAAEKPDPKVIDQANEALSLVKQHVPAAMRNAQRLGAVSASLEVTRRNLARDARLGETIAKVNAASAKLATASGADVAVQLAAAYDARKQLLMDYPKLVDDPVLADAIKKVSLNEQMAVSAFTVDKDAETADRESKVRATLSLAARPLSGTAGDASNVLIVVAPGSLVGLNAASGEPLWRRSLGVDSVPTPLLLSGGDVGDAVIADTSRQELLRIEAATGKLRWRLNLEEPISAGPTLFGNELLLPLRSGKLARIDLNNGRWTGGWQLPHALEVAPAVDVRRKLIYQLAAHSNLYVLSPTDPVCREVLYLGHEASSILTPPALVSRYLMIVENNGLKDSVLRVVQSDENGLQLANVHSEPLGGHVDTPPVVDGRILNVATDRGGLYAFEIGVPGKGRPLSRLAERAPTLAEPMTHYSLVRENRLWVAGGDLTLFGIQATGGKFAPDGVTLEKSVFLQSPLIAGEALALVRRPLGALGIEALAVSISGRDPIWETDFAAPLVGGVALAGDGQTVIALDAAGNLYRVPPAELGRGGFSAAPTVVPEWPAAMTAADLSNSPLRLEDGALLWTFGRQAKRVLQVTPDGAASWIALPEEVTSPLQRFRTGAVVAGQQGRIYAIDLAHEANLLEPYQPRVAADDDLRRFGPTVVDEDRILSADANGKLTLLVVSEDPKPHFDIEREVTLDESLAGAPVVVGKRIYAVRANDTAVELELPSLEFVKSWPLGGKPLWGPELIGDRVLLLTASNELWCWNANADEPWSLPLAHGPLAGPPLAHGDELVLLTRDGTVIRVSADGAELAHVATGEPLFGRGAIVGQHVVAPGVDGTLHLISLPN